jgi:hypothetical protein
MQTQSTGAAATATAGTASALLKVADAVERFKAGKLVVMLEYRSGRADSITYRDKLTRQPMVLQKISHSLEFADGTQVTLNERVPDNARLDGWQPPFAKGTRVLVTVSRFVVEKGVASLGGSMESVSN